MNANNSILMRDLLATYKQSNGFEGRTDDEVFEIFVVQQLTKDEGLSYQDIEECIVDGTQDGGIDAFLIAIDDQPVITLEQAEDIKIGRSSAVKILIAQIKSSKSFSEVALDKLHISLAKVFDLEYSELDLLENFHPHLAERITVMRNVWSRASQTGAKTDIVFIYASMANEIMVNAAFRAKQAQIAQLVRNAATGLHVNFELHSAKELLELYQQRRDITLPLRFKESPVAVEFADGEYGFVGVVALKDYYDLVVDDNGELREYLFESNIRHYQGAVDVNDGILATLNGDMTVDFWWLNNGVTIIASSCRPYPKTLNLDNVQIVNGLQTSYIIGKHYDKKLPDDSRSVLVKVVVISNENEENKTKINKIISASNKQNPVNTTILRATDDIQRRLELFFSNRGYYYDRRKNYYKNQNKPASKIFNIQYTAQAVEAIINRNPSAARSKPTSLMKTDESYNRIFNDDMHFNVYLNCCLLYQKVTEFIKASLPAEQRNLAKNFAYHLAEITTAILLSNASYTRSDVAQADINLLSSAHFMVAYNVLMDILDDYRKQNPEENVINIAKARKFQDGMNNQLPIKLAAL